MKRKQTIILIIITVLVVVLGTIGTVAYRHSANHGCASGEFWGYTGNPEGLNQEQIKERSSCHKEGLIY